MIIIELKYNENIDQALKRYKRKHRDLKIREEINERKHYTKKSIKRREEILKAQLKERKKRENNW